MDSELIEQYFGALIEALGPPVNREIAIAITNVEQALLWYRRSLEVNG